jgi:phage terminase Nu1 subunit (DNA packaging protein)
MVVDTARQLNPNLVLINSVAREGRLAASPQLRDVSEVGVRNAAEPSIPGFVERPENATEQSRAAILNSWKEIASFLDRGVRTVQRWERELQLPVHRIGKGNRSPVFAFTSEIKLWLYANRAKLAAEQGVNKLSVSKPAQCPAQNRVKASWVRCQQLTEELSRLMQQHQLHTLRLVENLQNPPSRGGRIAQELVQPLIEY